MKLSLGVSNLRIKGSKNQIVLNLSFTRDEYLILIWIVDK